MVLISSRWNQRVGKAFIMFSIIVSMIISVARSDENIGLCCLCNACKPAYRMDFFIDDHGTTCRELALEMADPSNSSKQGNTVCRKLQSQHRQTCCDPNYNPVEIPQAPVAGEKNPYSTGKYNTCYLCRYVSRKQLRSIHSQRTQVVVFHKKWRQIPWESRYAGRCA